MRFLFSYFFNKYFDFQRRPSSLWDDHTFESFFYPRNHKSNLEFQSISCIVVTSIPKLFHFLFLTLSHSTFNNAHVVNNAFHFVNKINQLSLLKYEMLSLDLKSCVINVPVPLAINSLGNRYPKFSITLATFMMVQWIDVWVRYTNIIYIQY